MWIRRLAVEHWRGLTHALEGLAPGLNLIAGPNEAGKSRLVQALRFALFESTKGKSEHKRTLATWGVAPEKPRVIVDFTLRGIDWHLEKVFLGPGCNTQLRSSTETLDGEAAETRLADLLGVAPGKTTELKPEDRGVWALLWVDQGSSREEPQHSATSQTQVLDRLSREVGEAAAGEFGQRLLHRAAEQHGRFHSLANGKPLKLLTDPEIQVAQIRERLAAAVGRRDALAHAAAALAAARAREQELTARLADADARLADVGTRFETAQTLAYRLEVAEGAVKLAERERSEALARQQAAAALDVEARHLGREIESGSAARVGHEKTRDALQLAAAASSQAVAEIEARITACDARIAALRQRERRVRQRSELARLRSRLAEGRAADARITGSRRTLAGLASIDERDVAALRNAEAARDRARARLEGASASLVLTAHQPLSVDGNLLAAGQVRQVLVDEDQRIEIDNLLSIAVHPGGGEVVRLREAVHDAGRALTELLTHLGIADTAAAEQVARQRREIEVELRQSVEALERLAPEGIDELNRQVAELTVALGAGADATGDVADSGAADAERLRVAEFEAAEAESRALGVELQEARADREVGQERLTRARETLAGLAQQLATDRAALARVAARRGELPHTEALEHAASEAERAYGERVAARDDARRQFDASGGSALALDLAQARQAVKQLRDQQQRTVSERIELAAELKAGSNQALHEEVLDLEAELGEAETRLARLQREAAAAKRLYELLSAEYRIAQERLTQPVIERIRPYLADLFPGSEVWIDEELALKGLRSGHADEAFEALSGGAREQLSLLVRIGLAEVVGADESWPLVLDDVLVNTDAERIRRMQRALYHAGRRMQILLFTCHGALFDALGPDRLIELPASVR